MLTENLLRAIAWTLVHSIWQGLIAAMIVALIITMTKRSPARLRYNLFSGVMLLFIISALVTFLIQYSDQVIVTGNSTVTGTSIDAKEIIVSNANWKQQLYTWFDNNSNWVLSVWAVFFLLYCIKLITGLVSIERLRSYKTYEVSEYWNEKLHDLQERVGVSGVVKVLESGLVKVPVALGFLKPVILLPIGLITRLTPEQVETILLHELAHIRRKDYVINIIQHFFEAIFFFNPAFVWISTLLRQEREACCDDLVVELSGQRREYLDALVGFQEFAIQSPAYAMGLGNRKEYLLKRVKRMLTKENYRLAIGEKLVLATSILLLSAFTLAEKKDEVRKVIEPVVSQASTIQTLTSNDTIPKQKSTKPAKQKPVKEFKNLGAKPFVDSLRRIEKSLKEIESIKKDMQVMKDEIGVYKEKYSEADSAQKKVITKKIEAKREELQVKRVQLNEERAKMQGIGKEKHHEDIDRKKNEGKTIEVQKNEARASDSRKAEITKYDVKKNDVRTIESKKNESRTADSKKNENLKQEINKDEKKTIDSRKNESRKEESRIFDTRNGQSRTIVPHKFEPRVINTRRNQSRTNDSRKYEPRITREFPMDWDLDKSIDWQIDSKLFEIKNPPTKQELKYTTLDLNLKKAPPQKVPPGKPGYKAVPFKKVPPANS